VSVVLADVRTNFKVFEVIFEGFEKNVDGLPFRYLWFMMLMCLINMAGLQSIIKVCFVCVYWSDSKILVMFVLHGCHYETAYF